MRTLGWFGSGLIVVSTALLWGVNTNTSAAADELDAVPQQFAGHYELHSFVSFPPEGGEVVNSYEGRITYDGHGHMSVIGMPKDLPARAAASSENVSGGFSYYGDVSWDVESKIVTHHVTGSASRGSMVGDDIVRYYEWVDGLLVLATKDSEGRIIAKFSWRRFE
jgi:hypothetical protein